MSLSMYRETKAIATQPTTVISKVKMGRQRRSDSIKIIHGVDMVESSKPMRPVMEAQHQSSLLSSIFTAYHIIYRYVNRIT